jgi:hypothetical protein
MQGRHRRVLYGRNDPVQRGAAEITEHITDTGAERTDEGASQAAAAEAAGAEEPGAYAVEAAGHFRIYLGAAAGVGKTYAMLSEGQRRRKRGADVVVGFFESHGRRLTKDLLDGLEVVPPKVVEYRGSWWQHLTGHGSNVRRVLREAGAVGIDVHVIARGELAAAASAQTELRR